MITVITSTCELGGGEYRMWLIEKNDDPAKIADGRRAYLYQSTIIKATYLFIEVTK